MKIEHKSLTLGEVLDGDRMAKSQYKIKFKQNIEDQVLCTNEVSLKDINTLKSAIEDFYFFEFVAGNTLRFF